MSLISTAAEVVGMNSLKIIGDLTMHGITRPVVFDVTYRGPSHFIDDDKTYTTYGIDASACVRRGELS